MNIDKRWLIICLFFSACVILFLSIPVDLKVIVNNSSSGDNIATEHRVTLAPTIPHNICKVIENGKKLECLWQGKNFLEARYYKSELSKNIQPSEWGEPSFDYSINLNGTY